MSSVQMPRQFRGRATERWGTCGICGKNHGFRPGLTRGQVKHALRGMGWTYRDDLGWVCPCRHLCELEPENRPSRRRRKKGARGRSSSRRYPKPTARVREIIRRRNRQDGE